MKSCPLYIVTRTRF